MKKVLVLGLLALAASAFTQQQASAWVNSKLGLGLTWDYQAGGNSALFGAFRSNQPGGADPTPHHYGKYGYGYSAPAPVPYPAPMIQPQKLIIPAPAGVPIDHSYGYQPYVSPYHFATYPRPVYYYYYYPSYAQ